mgnify:CR=1 FL=1
MIIASGTSWSVVESRAFGQLSQTPPVISAATRVNPLGTEFVECSCAASRLSVNEVAVIAGVIGVNGVLPYDGVAVGISLNGGATFATTIPTMPYTAPNSDNLGYGLDTFISSERDSGRIWFGGLIDTKLRVTFRDPGESTWLNHGYVDHVHPGSFRDRPSMGVGYLPPAMGTEKVYYLMSKGRPGAGCSGENPFWCAQTTVAQPLPIWPTPVLMQPDSPDAGDNPCNYDGWANQPVVLNDGTVVVVAADADPDLGGRLNENRPYVIRYVYDETVSPPRQRWFPENGDGILIGDLSIPPIQATQVSAPSTATNDAPWGIDRLKCSPSIAVDYSKNPEWVYVAFYARAVAGDLNQDLNTDIYIARSTDGGATFLNANIVHLTDQMLGINNAVARGPDQLVPAIAVDCSGAVSLVYYDNRNDSDNNYAGDWCDVYYTRIKGIGSANLSVLNPVRLTPAKFPIDATFLGDYHTLAPAGPNAQAIYTAYIAREYDAGSQTWSDRNCYVRKITPSPCLADLNLNGSADVGDFDDFVDAFLAEDVGADLNQDLLVDSDDVTTFMISYDELEYGE